MRTFKSELYPTTVLKSNVTNILSVPKINIMQLRYGQKTSSQQTVVPKSKAEKKGKYPSQTSKIYNMDILLNWESRGLDFSNHVYRKLKQACRQPGLPTLATKLKDTVNTKTALLDNLYVHVCKHTYIHTHTHTHTHTYTFFLIQTAWRQYLQ